jgi:hypothetical protein
MKELKTIFSIAAAVVAAVPGFGLLFSNLEIPPGESRMLYGGVLEALSIMTFLIIWLNRKKIETLDSSRAIKIALWSLSFFLFFLLLYIFLLQSQVRDQIIFPFFPTGDLKNALLQDSSWNKVILDYHAEGTQKLILKSNATMLILTKIIFLLLFQIPMVLLVASFSILGINLKNQV